MPEDNATSYRPNAGDSPDGMPGHLFVKGMPIACTNEHMFVRQGYRYVTFPVVDVLFLRADGNYTDIVTSDRKYTLRLGLGNVLCRFPPLVLVRIHRGYAVNHQRVDSLSDGTVQLGLHSLPVGRQYRDAFLQRFRRL